MFVSKRKVEPSSHALPLAPPGQGTAAGCCLNRGKSQRGCQKGRPSPGDQACRLRAQGVPPTPATHLHFSPPRFPAQGAEPPGGGRQRVHGLRGGAPWWAVGSPVPQHLGRITVGRGVPGAAVRPPQLLPGAGCRREDLPGAHVPPGPAVAVPPAAGEKSPLQEGSCHM